MNDQERFVDDTFCKIAEKEEKGESLTKEENTVLLIWHSYGVIGNGGLQYFFEQELDALAHANAYDEVGLPRCAELLRLGYSLFPEEVLKSEWKERLKFVDSKDELFNSVGTQFWKEIKGIESLLAEFIRRNRENISVLDP